MAAVIRPERDSGHRAGPRSRPGIFFTSARGRCGYRKSDALHQFSHPFSHFAGLAYPLRAGDLVSFLVSFRKFLGRFPLERPAENSVSWSRFEPGFSRHPKRLESGVVASWLWICSVDHCTTYLTDGLVCDSALSALSPLIQGATLKKTVATLVTCRAWERVPEGYLVHDYLDHQLSAAQVDAERRANRDRYFRWRQRVSNAVSNAVGQRVSNAVSNAVDNALLTGPSVSQSVSQSVLKKNQQHVKIGQSGQCDTTPRQSDDGQPTWPSPEALVEMFNGTVPLGHPRVTKLTVGRRKKADQYLRQFPDEAFWRSAFAETGRSRFLRGLKPSPGHEGFRATFDWLLTKGKDGTENIVKVFEGYYRDRVDTAGAEVHYHV